MKTIHNIGTIELPKGVLASDLVEPGWKSKVKMAHEADGYRRLTFELWYTERFGWCIPTLTICSGHHRYRPSSATRRTYAARVSDGGLVRIGMGPHVTKCVTVYVKESRLAALQKFIDLRNKGEADANDCRDRISTRRARTEMRRSSLFGW